MNNVYLKVCTTGLNYGIDRIVSIDYKIDTEKEKRIIVKPNGPFSYPEELVKINNLSQSDIENGTSFQEAFNIFTNNTKGSKIIGHNICKCALTFIKNELKRNDMPNEYSNLWKNPIIDIFNLTRTVSSDRHLEALHKQFSKNEFKSTLESLSEIYPIILNSISPEEKLSNELSPSGWLKIIDNKVYFAKGKYTDCSLDDTLNNISESYMTFIKNNSEPHTINCLTHYDSLKKFLKKN